MFITLTPSARRNITITDGTGTKDVTVTFVCRQGLDMTVKTQGEIVSVPVMELLLVINRKLYVHLTMRQQITTKATLC